MKQDNHTIEEDILELKQRFDTDPKLLHKQDYKHLIHTVEHISSGDSSTSDKKQWRCDTQRAVSKKGKLKYTDDGFAIADKSLSQNVKFYVNEKIAVTNDDGFQTDNYTIHAFYPPLNIEKEWLLKDIIGAELIEPGCIFTIYWNPNDPEAPSVYVLGRSNKIFTYYRSRKYIDGVRQDAVKRVSKGWAGRAFSHWSNFTEFLQRRKILTNASNPRLLAGTRVAVFVQSHQEVRNRYAVKHDGAKKDKHARCKWVVIRTKQQSYTFVNREFGYRGFGTPALYNWKNMSIILYHCSRLFLPVSSDSIDKIVLHCYIDEDNVKRGWVNRYYFDIIANNQFYTDSLNFNENWAVTIRLL